MPWGTPLVTVLRGLHKNGLGHNNLRFVTQSNIPVVKVLKSENVVLEAKAKEIADALSHELQRHGPLRSSDPAVKWLADVAHILDEIKDASLPALGEFLGIPGQVLRQARAPRRVIAAALLTADLTDAYKFLNNAVRELDERDVTTGRKRALVSRAVPIWVDLDAGREILSSAKLPPGRRLCGLLLSELDWGKHAAERAAANALEYPTVRLSSVAGEEAVAELVEQHDKTLRARLHFAEDDPPEFIEEEIRRKNASVFAVLDSTNLTNRRLRELLSKLRALFPGITFLLVSDRENRASWRFHPAMRVAIGRQDDLTKREIRRYLETIKALVKEPKQANGE